MFVRVVEVKTKPGNAREVCSMLHEKVLSTLKAQTGFVDEIVLVSDAEGILALSFWKTREDAERYSHEDYAKVSDIIQHLVHSKPKVHAFLSNVVTGSRTTEPRRWQVAEEMKKLEDAPASSVLTSALHRCWTA